MFFTLKPNTSITLSVRSVGCAKQWKDARPIGFEETLEIIRYASKRHSVTRTYIFNASFTYDLDIASCFYRLGKTLDVWSSNQVKGHGQTPASPGECLCHLWTLCVQSYMPIWAEFYMTQAVINGISSRTVYQNLTTHNQNNPNHNVPVLKSVFT